MRDYDYDEIEACIARARRLRSEAFGEYMAYAWLALKRGIKALASVFGAKVKDADRRPYLPA